MLDGSPETAVPQRREEGDAHHTHAVRRRGSEAPRRPPSPEAHRRPPAAAAVTGTVVVDPTLVATGPVTLDCGPGLASPAQGRRTGYNSGHGANGQRQAAGQRAGR
jgi:hypothetical protein